MSRSKSDDEVFCRSCGEKIKKSAEICPNCGVRNPKYEADEPKQEVRANGAGASATQKRESRQKVEHDPSGYQTDVSDVWWKVLAGGLGLYVLSFLVQATIGPGTFSGMLLFLALVITPIGVYYDSKWIRGNSTWNPSFFWVVVAAVPLVGLFAGGVFLFRRHEVVGEP